MIIETVHDKPDGADSATYRNYQDAGLRARDSTVLCECGSRQFKVNFIQAPHSGCFLKVTCIGCGKEETIFDDYA